MDKVADKMRSFGVADAADEIERLLRLIGRAERLAACRHLEMIQLQDENQRLRALCGLPATGKLPELES
jgi:hypothetical protein